MRAQRNYQTASETIRTVMQRVFEWLESLLRWNVMGLENHEIESHEVKSVFLGDAL